MTSPTTGPERQTRYRGTPPFIHRKTRDTIFIALFLLLLWIPILAMLVRPDVAEGGDENRALAAAPELAWSEQAIKEFPRRFEAWYNDHFGFRNELVRQYHTVHFGWLGIADPEKVVKGKENWLYLGRDSLIDETRGLNPLSEEELSSWVSKLDGIRQWQEARGGQFLLALVPDKYRLYPEYLPDWLVPSTQRRKEQLLDALAPTGMAYLDLTDPLRAAKGSSAHPIWLKTDTHWTGVGAWYGYRAIAERLALTPLSDTAVHLVDAPPAHEGLWHTTGNLAGLLGVRALIPEDWVGIIPVAPRAQVTDSFPVPTRRVSGVNVPVATEIDDPSLPTALVIGGSFRWALVPLLSEHFRRVLYTDFRYCFFDEGIGAVEAPDIILFVMTEQQLLWFPEPPAEDTW